MTVFFTWLLRTIGIGGVAFLGLYIYDWGIPGASRIPYLSSIPILGDLTTGRAHSYAAEQVRLATSQMVTKFERDAIAAQLSEERRRRLIADQLTTEASKRADAALRAKSEAEAELEARIAADTSPDGGRWSEEDQQWDGRR
ncbi:hypothetical protein ACDY96_21350 [Rhizobium mongolense]|uniref:hypothetical protein n=1 Tax=Rhizobium mongolense TaxID=57676 RepID=UPI003556E2BF